MCHAPDNRRFILGYSMLESAFITDFERTANSDELHGVLGRALIIATRFDSDCAAAATLFKLKRIAPASTHLNEDEYANLISNIVKDTTNLNRNIQALKLPEDLKEILNAAREARNEVAHAIGRGLTGCLDTKVHDQQLISEVSSLINTIAHGDYVISMLLSIANKDSLPISETCDEYRHKIVHWVVER